MNNMTDNTKIISIEQLPIRTFPPTSNPKDDLTGQVFGKLTVVGMAANDPAWVVKCECGIFTRRKTRALRSGNVTSCSECLQKQSSVLNNLNDHIAETNFYDNHSDQYWDGIKLSSLGETAFDMYWVLKRLLCEGFTDDVSAEISKVIANAEIGRVA